QKFMDQNPNVKVEVDWWQGTDSTKILALKASGQLGDLIHSLRVPFDVMARNELIRPLDDIVKGAGVDLKQWYPNAVDLFRFDVKSGKRGNSSLPLMGLPIITYSGATILFYNADTFAKKGVPPPTDATTFDDLVQTALKMTDRPSGADAANVYGFMEPAW